MVERELMRPIQDTKPAYERPTLTHLGSFADLTRGDNKGGLDNGTKSH
jgi:hypothetical protein